jgi:RNA polymerase sigma-70 factor (ECF subfamily)
VTALRDLPLHYRQVLVLHYLVDLPVQQVAAELGLPQGTVVTQLARGRLALAQRLGPDHNQHEAQNV